MDTGAIIRAAAIGDDPATRRRLVREMLWKELDLKDSGTFEQQTEVAWRGTARLVDVLFENIRDEDRMPSARFQPDPDTIRLVIDYPWDEGDHSPAEDLRRISKLKAQLPDLNTLFWLPHFLSEDRKADLATLVAINYALERDRLTGSPPR